MENESDGTKKNFHNNEMSVISRLILGRRIGARKNSHNNGGSSVQLLTEAVTDLHGISNV